MKNLYIKKLEFQLINIVSEKIYTFSDPESIYKSEIVKKELKLADREKFMAFFLNGRNKVLSYEIISIGSLNSSIVHPRESFKGAIMSSATSIVFVHNHPTGDPTPSNDDIAITKRLVESGKILGIKVLDHIIIGDNDYFSFSKENLL